MTEVATEKARQLLSQFGRCYSQEPKTAPQEQLPKHVLDFYRTVGPSNITVGGMFFPALDSLLDKNAKHLACREGWFSHGRYGYGLDDIHIIIFDINTDEYDASLGHVASIGGDIAHQVLTEESHLSYSGVGLSLPIISVCLALEEIIEIDVEKEEKSWLIEMERRLTQLSEDSKISRSWMYEMRYL
ncbi:hypothetical protein N9Y42_03130 [Mariniblastus sp.]|nr:hypothetical protein [Mariniblastus sp.]